MIENNKEIQKYLNKLERDNYRYINNNIRNLLPRTKNKFSAIKSLRNLDDTSSKIFQYEIITSKIYNEKLNKLYIMYLKDKKQNKLSKFINFLNTKAKNYISVKYCDFVRKILEVFEVDKIMHNLNITFNKLVDEYLKLNVKSNNFPEMNKQSFCKVLNLIDENLYKEFNNVLKNIKDNQNIDMGAINFYLPNEKIDYIYIRDNIDSVPDFVAHEIGHILERKYNECKYLEYSLISISPYAEFFSSYLELLFIVQSKKAENANDDFNYLYKDYLYQTILGFIKVKTELEYLSESNDKSTSIELCWNNIINNSAPKIVKLKEFNFSSNFTFSFNILEEIKYLLGRMISLLLMCNNKLNFKTFKELAKHTSVINNKFLTNTIKDIDKI